jgi:hypothetical protein
MFRTFLARPLPVSSAMKPTCIKNTRNLQQEICTAHVYISACLAGPSLTARLGWGFWAACCGPDQRKRVLNTSYSAACRIPRSVVCGLTSCCHLGHQLLTVLTHPFRITRLVLTDSSFCASLQSTLLGSMRRTSILRLFGLYHHPMWGMRIMWVPPGSQKYLRHSQDITQSVWPCGVAYGQKCTRCCCRFQLCCCGT